MPRSAAEREPAREAPVTGSSQTAAERLRVRGVVQGVGFRPFVYALAARHGLSGWVRNTSAGVEIHVEGPAEAVDAFATALPGEAPPRAHIAEYTRAPGVPEGARGFVILESAAAPGEYQLVSPDIATCDDCRRELLDPADRRFRYPFTNCTNCGPRFTIIEELPYDRERTTMRHFPLCPACRKEYEDPADRRFHAEPNACPVCGPRVKLLRPAHGRAGADPASGPDTGAGPAVEVLAEGTAADPAAPIDLAAQLLLRGEIVALKGLGGFHLACDATDGEAVRRLKDRKRRPHKPLAVMFRDLEQARAHCEVSRAAARVLTSPEHPIVLLPWRPVGADGVAGPELGTAAGGRQPARTASDGLERRDVDPEVAVGQGFLGVMLPYTPLHILLLRAAGRPLVMTSGNLAEEPIVKAWDEIGRLAPVADVYLVHDREIAVRYDDTVVQVSGETARPLRRSRGYAPFPVPLPRRLPQVLACGAELKNTFCLTRERDAFVSQHIGDLENLETLEHFEASIDVYRHLFRLEPEVVAHDLHPEYLATKYALGLDLPDKVAVQHHHAHVAARMVEHGREAAVTGVSMDGLGYGHDGVLWGGEVLVCDLLGYRRAAHLEELPLPGGAAAIGNPWRTAAGWALALLGEAGLERALRLLQGGGPAGPDPTDEQVQALVHQVRRGVNTPLTTSCGRLFDAVAALAGVRHTVTYEGQAAIELEMRSADGGEPYPWTVDGDAGAAAAGPRQGAAAWAAGGPEEPAAAVVRLAPLFGGVLADLERGAPGGLVGARLHASVAGIVLQLCRAVRDAGGPTTVALTGGVFQNQLLTGLCERALSGDGFEVLPCLLVPGNDGGVSLGQAAVAGYTVLQRRGELG